MTSFSKKSVWLLTIGAFFAFLVFGLSDNLKGPTLPALLADLNINYSTGGTILLGAYLGFMIATLTTGLLADKVGQKAVLILATFCMAGGVTGFSLFSTPLLLTASMLLLGFGLGGIELGCNALIVELHNSDKGRYLNLMAVMHGLGSMIGPLYAGALLAGHKSWRVVYAWDLVLIGLLAFYFSMTVFPPKADTISEKLDLLHLGRKAFSLPMILFYCAITVYVATEIGIAAWMVEFLQKERQFSVTQSTQALSLFFGLIMIGRFLGSFLVEKLGYLKSIFVSSLAASSCIALALFGSNSLSYLLPASGFFLSIIFPTITAAVSDGHNENMNTILGLLFTFAGFGGVLGPWLIGIISDLVGIKLGFALNLVFGLLTALSVFLLLRVTSIDKNHLPAKIT